MKELSGKKYSSKAREISENKQRSACLKRLFRVMLISVAVMSIQILGTDLMWQRWSS